MRTQTGWVATVLAMGLFVWATSIAIAAQGTGCADGSYYRPVIGSAVFQCTGDCPNGDVCFKAEFTIPDPPGSYSVRCICDPDPIYLYGVPYRGDDWYDDEQISSCRLRIIFVPASPPIPAYYQVKCDKVNCDNKCVPKEQGLLNITTFCDCPQ